MTYSENDPFAAAWLRELMREEQIPEGKVDERDIRDLGPADCGETFHAFAGIGGWPYALRLAGWPDDQPVWTGSCPCQPFSSAGKRGAVGDERHLWPAFRSLIAECRPATIFGEQVASKLGRRWLAGVRADLEQLGYAVGAADLPAACVGAPHIRQRLFWVAYAEHARRDGIRESQGAKEARRMLEPEGRCSGLGDANSPREGQERRVSPWPGTERTGGVGRMGDTEGERRQRREDYRDEGRRQRTSRPADPWSDSRLILCGDGKTRRVPESGIQPLASRIPNRMGTLRGAGNAIVPQVAAAFVRAALSATSEP